MPKSATKDSNWKTEAMIRRPPEAPTAISGWPPLAAITGHMLFSARLPGPMAFGVPGMRVEPHDAVVHHDAGARQHDARAHRGEQRRGHRHHHAVLVGDGDVGGAAVGTLGFGIAEAGQPLGIGILHGAGEPAIPGGGGLGPGPIGIGHAVQHPAQGRRRGQPVRPASTLARARGRRRRAECAPGRRPGRRPRGSRPSPSHPAAICAAISPS